MNDDAIFFAKTNFRGEDRTFGIKNNDRRQHFYIIGKSGTGKTALLANLALQDIKNNKGVAIVDPHGDFVEEIVEKIPENRMSDVIYFNPADTEYPIGFNVLEVSDPKYKHLVASDLIGIFTKIWANVWSARMEYILNNCVLALLDTPGTTLLGIPRILVDRDYRQMIVGNIKDPVVRAFWLQEYESWRDQFRNEAIVPIQNKVGQFLSTSLIRNIVGQPKSTMDIQDIMNSSKILLVNVSKGRVGEDNSNLLGAMIITKIQLAAMERVRISEEERHDFYLYVDEFQNFATESFASVLSEARKYRLNLIIAHQYIGQLVTDISTKVRDAIFGNVGTMVIFRVGAADAEFLEKEFEPEFTIQDLVGLPNYNIYLKLMVNGVTSRPFSANTLPPITLSALTIDREKIAEMSRKLYASSRERVEEQINRWSSSVGAEAGEEGMISRPAAAAGPSGKYQAVCWTCGKETEVSFKPMPGRAVYCQNCLKKIEKREISPINLPRAGHEKKRFEPTLGKLGIEFEESPMDRTYQTRPLISQRPSSGPKDRSLKIREQKLEVAAPTIPSEKKKTISLSELQNRSSESAPNSEKQFSRERKKSSQKSSHLADLRKVLEEFVGEKLNPVRSNPAKRDADSVERDRTSNGVNPQKEKKEEFKENPTADKPAKEKNLSPGETIKFE